jgi:predicted glutamine amidotransferase
MNKDSGPSPDGFGLGFYKETWDTIFNNIFSFFSAFHSNSLNLESVNRSFLVVLPK